jgi:hypothetical protein
MNCSPSKSRTMVGSAAPIAVYNMVHFSIPKSMPLRLLAGGVTKEVTHKFHGGQENRDSEGEYDAPELPILWHGLVAILGSTWPKLVGRLGQGRRARRDIHGLADQASLSEIASQKGETVSGSDERRGVMS